MTNLVLSVHRHFPPASFWIVELLKRNPFTEKHHLTDGIPLSRTNPAFFDVEISQSLLSLFPGRIISTRRSSCAMRSRVATRAESGIKRHRLNLHTHTRELKCEALAVVLKTVRMRTASSTRTYSSARARSPRVCWSTAS